MIYAQASPNWGMRPGPGDAPIPGGGSIAFVLAAQEKSLIDFTSSVVDYEFGDDTSAGAHWRITPAGWGPWNTTAVVSEQKVPLAASVNDPRTQPGASETPGAIIAAPGSGVVGVVGADGRLNTDLAALAEEGEISANISGIPGTLTTTDGMTWFDPIGPGELADGNRLIFTRPGVVLTVGRVHRQGDRWMVTRAATTRRTLWRSSAD
ncbi:hypothetical protein Aglo01_56400 [Actinokineospora globicatena]|nr:hypothetical protein Aglo01_56400 [Actinokineospora globicatena]GLW88352.1 hypothetical protein Aglo02_59910 [Actinokineospora globicatena]